MLILYHIYVDSWWQLWIVTMYVHYSIAGIETSLPTLPVLENLREEDLDIPNPNVIT
jgi:hypothetical protein